MRCERCAHQWSDHDVYGCTRNRCNCVNPFRLTMPAWFSSIGKGTLSAVLAGVLVAVGMLALTVAVGIALGACRPGPTPTVTPTVAPLKTAHQGAPSPWAS